jgi:hypothetical protein
MVNRGNVNSIKLLDFPETLIADKLYHNELVSQIIRALNTDKFFRGAGANRWSPY